MSDTTLTLDEIFEEAGLAAKWEVRGEAKSQAKYLAEGEARKAIEIARNMMKRNRPIDEIIEDTGLTREEVENLSY